MCMYIYIHIHIHNGREEAGATDVHSRVLRHNDQY